MQERLQSELVFRRWAYAVFSAARRWAYAVFLGLLARTPSAFSAEPVIELSKVPPTPRFVVRGLSGDELAALAGLAPGSPAWRKILVVSPERTRQTTRDAGPDADAGKAAAKFSSAGMLGDYGVADGELRFVPRFPLQAGLAYRATLDLNAIQDHGRRRLTIERVFAIPRRETPRTRLLAIFPTSDLLPENQLKLYLHFSAPMREGDIYRHIRLRDQEGNLVALPFLEIDQELWDRSRTRLTLLFDPGRIKRGLKPRIDFGPILEEGKSYTLTIDGNWRDAQDQPLGADHHKKFQAGGPDETQPDPRHWKLHPPEVVGRGPLTIEFGEPLDHAMLTRVLSVVDAVDERIAGEISIDRHETRWTFTPSQPWRPGRYRLVVETTLEDLAGNSIGRPFELDEFRQIERQSTAETMELVFEVRLP